MENTNGTDDHFWVNTSPALHNCPLAVHRIKLSSTIYIVLGLTLGIWACFEFFRSAKSHSLEPPCASPRVPYIGHVLGLLSHGFDYFAELSRKLGFPIFTVAMPGTTMYIVTTPNLTQSVMKQHKALPFGVVAVRYLRLAGISPEAQTILMANVDGAQGEWGLFAELRNAMRVGLAGGPSFDQMTQVMIQNIASFLDNSVSPELPIYKVKLSRWLRDLATLATTNSIYGHENPFKSQKIQDGFWQFQNGLLAILIGIFPSITAKKAVAGRESATKAFEHYYHVGGHESGSLLIKEVFKVMAKYNLSLEDSARVTLWTAIASLVNTGPTLFWMILSIYSDPELLEAIRKEVASISSTEKKELSGATSYNIDIAEARTYCPLLVSTLQEVLRYRGIHSSVRQAIEDTILDGKWLVRKNGIVQVPSRVLHMDSATWGSDADQFKAGRFMKGSKSKRPNLLAFRAFGGGSTLCPGRQFSFIQMLAVVAIIVMKFDIEPASGKWVFPGASKSSNMVGVMEPDTDIDVVISLRKGWENCHWKFSSKNSVLNFNVETSS